MKKINFKEFLVVLASAIVVAFSFVFVFSSFKKSYDPGATQHYIRSGTGTPNLRMMPTKVYHCTVVPTVSNGGSYDISALGLTAVLGVQVSVTRNTASVIDVPSVSIKSLSTSAIVYNIVQANNATVAILGINVLSGTPQVFVATPTDCTLNFQITGY